MSPCHTLIASLLSFEAFSKTLPCDGVEYTDLNGYTRTEAAGVCLPNTYSASSMKVCDPANTSTIFQAIWDTATDCSGTPTSTETWNGMHEYSNITVTCCSATSGIHSQAKRCEYALITESAQFACPGGVDTYTYAYVIGTCSKNVDIYPDSPSFYTACTDGELQYNYYASDGFNCAAAEPLGTNGTLSNEQQDISSCYSHTITCHTAQNTCLVQVDEKNIIAYLGWIAFVILIIIYATYKGILYIRLKCDKQSKVTVTDPQLKATLLELTVNDNTVNSSNINEEEFVDSFKPSIFSSFTDIQDMINSCIFMLYFYENTGYDLDSPVGKFQIFLFCVEILFQMIDLFVCIVWYFNLNIKLGNNMNIAVNRKLIVNYYKFKIIQINFSFLKVLFKLYYSFDYLHQNVTFYNIVFALTMVFKSYWMVIIDFMAKAQGTKVKTSGIKSKILDKAQNSLVQLIIIMPLFYMVNSIILALEAMNNRLVMLFYCIFWFLAPWIYFLSTKLSKYIQFKACNMNCEECMKLLCGILQCFITTTMFLIGIVGGIFVSLPQLQFTLTVVIYGVSGLVVCFTCIGQYCKGGSFPYEDILRCCCIIYMLPFIIAVGFYTFEDIIMDETQSDEYDGEYNNENENEYEPEFEPIGYR